MWMFEVELSDRRRLHAYKHIDTRRYIHLAADGKAFAYLSAEQYRPIPAADVLAAIFAPLPGLWGVTANQVAESWAAVARLGADHVPDLNRSWRCVVCDRPWDVDDWNGE
jgi:hypothetical protein